MSQDVYYKINFNTLLHSFVFQCAPVIARVKIANLLIVRRSLLKDAFALIAHFDLTGRLLYFSEEKAYILVYDKDAIASLLEDRNTSLFFQKQGYKNLYLHDILFELSNRYKAYMEHSASFPHELGVLLGYPLNDVISYISHNGKDFLLTGYWKVYSNVASAKETFRLYDDVTEKMLTDLLKTV